MMKNKIFKFLILASALLLASGCGSSPEAEPTLDPVVIMTQVAGTIQAEITQAALLNPEPTIAPPPTATMLPIPTLPVPFAPTAPSSGAVPAPGLPALSPDNAIFIEDVTVPDDTVFWQGERFTKTWKIENTGTTIWNTGYRLIYYHGEPIMCNEEYMNVYLTQSVDPNNQVTLSVKMTAPDILGTYVNHFVMINDKGEVFGDPLYVQIKVGTTADKTPKPTG